MHPKAGAAGLVEDLLSEDDDHDRHLGKPLSSYSSSDSLDQDAYVSDTPTEDLDKLSMCLSEASSETNESKKSSLFGEIFQAQVALWTLIGSIFYSYAWQQHRKKFLLSLFVVVPSVLVVCCTMSSLLTAIVIMGRLFSTPLSVEDMLKYGGSEDEAQRKGRWRSPSTASSVSGQSSPLDELPKPVCRKHSSSNGSLNHISYRSTSPNSLNSNGRAASHRLSYTYTHCSGGADEFK